MEDAGQGRPKLSEVLPKRGLAYAEMIGPAPALCKTRLLDIKVHEDVQRDEAEEAERKRVREMSREQLRHQVPSGYREAGLRPGTATRPTTAARFLE